MAGNMQGRKAGGRGGASSWGTGKRSAGDTSNSGSIMKAARPERRPGRYEEI